MAYTCNPATLEAEFWDAVGSRTVGVTVFNRWVDSVIQCDPPAIQHRGRGLTKYWDLAKTLKQTKIPSWTKLVNLRKLWIQIQLSK